MQVNYSPSKPYYLGNTGLPHQASMLLSKPEHQGVVPALLNEQYSSGLQQGDN